MSKSFGQKLYGVDFTVVFRRGTTLRPGMRLAVAGYYAKHTYYYGYSSDPSKRCLQLIRQDAPAVYAVRTGVATVAIIYRGKKEVARHMVNEFLRDRNLVRGEIVLTSSVDELPISYLEGAA